MEYQKRLLIIEDDDSIRESLRSYLEQNSFAVDTAADGESGVRLALSKPYDVVILDNSLPKKLGLEVCQDIRAAGKDVPIIIISVYSDVSNKVSLLRHGADDYMSKPLAPEELLARIQAIFRRMDEDAYLLSVKDLTVHANNRTVKRGNREISMTKTEFNILLLLIQNKNRVVPRESIIKHIWPDAVSLTMHALDTHIANIRRKIGGAGRSDLLYTVAKIGYRLS